MREQVPGLRRRRPPSLHPPANAHQGGINLDNHRPDHAIDRLARISVALPRNARYGDPDLAPRVPAGLRLGPRPCRFPFANEEAEESEFITLVQNRFLTGSILDSILPSPVTLYGFHDREIVL